MADDTPKTPDANAADAAAGATGPNAPGAARAALPPVQILAQYVKDLSFENPNAPASLQPGNPAPQVSVSVDVKTQQVNETNYEVVLSIRGEAKSGEKRAFIVELAYAGLASVANVPKEAIAPLLLIEVPRLLFPFARAVIAEATRDGGFPPLLVQSIDFTDLFRRQLQALRARQGTGGDAAPGQQPPVSVN